MTAASRPVSVPSRNVADVRFAATSDVNSGALGFFLRAAISINTLRIVLRDIPVALLTALKPPRP